LICHFDHSRRRRRKRRTRKKKKMIDPRFHGLVLGFIVLVALVSPAAAFGAGNIGSTSKVEGQNCMRTNSPPFAAIK